MKTKQILEAFIGFLVAGTLMTTQAVRDILANLTSSATYGGGTSGAVLAVIVPLTVAFSLGYLLVSVLASKKGWV